MSGAGRCRACDRVAGLGLRDLQLRPVRSIVRDWKKGAAMFVRNIKHPVLYTLIDLTGKAVIERDGRLEPAPYGYTYDVNNYGVRNVFNVASRIQLKGVPGLPSFWPIKFFGITSDLKMQLAIGLMEEPAVLRSLGSGMPPIVPTKMVYTKTDDKIYSISVTVGGQEFGLFLRPNLMQLLV